MRVAELPAQIIVGEAVAVRVGLGLTSNAKVPVVEQPPLDAVTVYIVVTTGETTTLLPVKAPGFHVYEVAPKAVKVEDDPLQIAVGVAARVKTGNALTTTFTVELPVQP